MAYILLSNNIATGYKYNIYSLIPGGGGGGGGIPPFPPMKPCLGLIKIHKLDRNKHNRILNRSTKRTRKLVISIMSLENQEWPEYASEAFSEHLKFKNFLGEHKSSPWVSEFGQVALTQPWDLST